MADHGPALNATTQFMKQCAGSTGGGSKNARANSNKVHEVRNLVHQLGEEPKKDYGPTTTVLDKAAVAHSSSVTLAINALADKLTDLAVNDTDTYSALAASGFVAYFAKYYCSVMKIDYKRTDNLEYSNLCNSSVIGPNLGQMLEKVKTG